MTLASFSLQVGERFEAFLEDSPSAIASVVLVKAEPHPKVRTESDRPFSLVFEGDDSGPALDQGTYWLRAPDREAEPIFIVPIGPRRYEAVFN